jgi:hypothetical protein
MTASLPKNLQTFTKKGRPHKNQHGGVGLMNS